MDRPLFPKEVHAGSSPVWGTILHLEEKKGIIKYETEMDYRGFPL